MVMGQSKRFKGYLNSGYLNNQQGAAIKITSRILNYIAEAVNQRKSIDLSESIDQATTIYMNLHPVLLNCKPIPVLTIV